MPDSADPADDRLARIRYTSRGGPVPRAPAEQVPPSGPPESAGDLAADARRALGFLGGKWVVPILAVLAVRPHRHGELRRALGTDLHDKVLTETLRRMETAALLRREATSGMPPTVRYALTPLGASLLEPIHHLARWTRSHRPALHDANHIDPENAAVRTSS